MWNSKTFFAFAVLIGLSVGIYFINVAQEWKLTEVEEQRKMEIIYAINSTQRENNQKFQELIDRIDKLIATMEVNNVSASK